ncbi:MAG: hypothetical protein HEEMFOPI_00053 [Holosporales bacterium]
MKFKILLVAIASCFLMHHSYPTTAATGTAANEPTANNSIVVEQLQDTTVLTSNHTVSITYNGIPFNIAAETIINYAQALIKNKTPSSLSITTSLYNNIVDDIGFLKSAINRNAFEATSSSTVVQALLDDTLKVTKKDVTKVFAAMGVSSQELAILQSAMTAAATIAQNSTQLANGKVTAASCLSCCLSTTLTIAAQMAAQQASNTNGTTN